MKNAGTSKESILVASRKLVAEKGLAAVNMRSVGKACDLALGSIYYYFPSKDDLLLATIASVWDDIFSWEGPDFVPSSDHANFSFPAYIAQFFDHLAEGIARYPHFFTIHSLSFSERGQAKGSSTMRQYLAEIEGRMTLALKRDKGVSPRAFSRDFTEEAFIDMVLTTMIALLVQKKDDPSALVEMVRRSLYFPE